MSLTAKDVAEIVRLLEESTFDELSLEIGDMKLSLRRGADNPVIREPRSSSPMVPKTPDTPDTGGVPTPKTPSEPGLFEVPSPLLGVFYRAPKPGEPPFIEVGAVVEEDTVIAIIEVMKLMNSVRAGVRGEVVQIPAQNGALVEFGEPLIRVRPAS